jgi:hypothetical protein
MTTKRIKSFSKHQKASLQLWFSHPSPQYGDICTWTWLPAADYGRSDWAQKYDKIEARTMSVLNSFQTIMVKAWTNVFCTAFRTFGWSLDSHFEQLSECLPIICSYGILHSGCNTVCMWL